MFEAYPMQTMSLAWLTTDFSIFGFHIQHWMPVVILMFVVFIVFSRFDHRRSDLTWLF